MRGNNFINLFMKYRQTKSLTIREKTKHTSPNTAPSANVTNTVFPSSATTSNFPLLIMYISFPTSPLRHT